MASQVRVEFQLLPLAVLALLPPDAYALLLRRSQQNGRSVGEEARAILLESLNIQPDADGGAAT